MADVQLDFGLDLSKSQNTIEGQLKEIVKSINSKGILKFSASLDDLSVEKVKKQVNSISKGASSNSSVFSTSQIDLYATKVQYTYERIKRLKKDVENLGNSGNVDISNVLQQYSSTQKYLNTAQNNRLSDKERLDSLDKLKTAYKQLNAEIQKSSTQYQRLKKSERETVNKDNNKLSFVTKANAKYNQLYDYIKKYESVLKKDSDLWNKGQNLLNDFANPDDKKMSNGSMENSIQDFKKQCKDAGIEADSLGVKLKNLFTEHLDTAVAMAGVHALQQALQQVYQNVVQLDSAVTDLQIASGYSRNQTKELVSEYSSLAQQLGSTTTQVANAADGWMRQGYSVADTNELVTNSMMLSKLGQIDSEEATTALTSALKGYKLEVSDASNVVDKFTAVDMEAAASAGGIAKSMAECATSANLAGISMDDLIGYLAEIKQVTQDGDELTPTMVHQSA